MQIQQRNSIVNQHAAAYRLPAVFLHERGHCEDKSASVLGGAASQFILAAALDQQRFRIHNAAEPHSSWFFGGKVTDVIRRKNIVPPMMISGSKCCCAAADHDK